MLWGFVFPTGAPQCEGLFLSPLSSFGYLAPDHISTPLTLFDAASSLHLVVEFVLPVPGVFWIIYTDVIVV